MTIKPDMTMAAIVVALHNRCKVATFKNESQPVARALIGTGKDEAKLPVRRFSYNQQLALAVAATRHIPDKEILKGLFDVELPCNAFWFAGPAVNSYNMLKLGKPWDADEGCRRGFLCQVTGEDRLDVLGMTELSVPAVEKLIGHPIPTHWQLQGKHIPGVEPCAVTRDGIEIMAPAETRAVKYKNLRLDRRGIGDAETLASASAEAAHLHMSFLARAILLLGCLTEADSPWRTAAQDKLSERQEELAHNKRRQNMNSTPELQSRPVTIDITAASLPGITREPKTMRELMGETWVKQSRPWRNHTTGLLMRDKQGRLIRRKAHKRRIAVAVDRTQTERQLTATRPDAKLDLSGDYPVLKL